MHLALEEFIIALQMAAFIASVAPVGVYAVQLASLATQAAPLYKQPVK